MSRFNWTLWSVTGACAVALVAGAAYARLATGDHSPDAANAAANDVVISGKDLEAAKAAASAVELPALADGRVTHEEYRAAIDASVSCLNQNGFAVEHFTDVKDGVLMGTFTRLRSAEPGPGIDKQGLVRYSATGGGGPSPEENSQTAADCMRRSELIDRLWKAHIDVNEAPPQERLNALSACLRKAGVAVPEHPTDRQILDVVGVTFHDGTVILPDAHVRAAWQVCEQQLAIRR